MSKWISMIAAIAAMVLAGSVVVTAATKKPAAKKPAAKKPAASAKQQTPHVVQGTTQLQGEYAEIGKTYTLGKNNPMNITLKSAEFTAEQVLIGRALHSPKAGEKLLVLHYNLHNPQKQEANVFWGTFSITAVDSSNENLEYVGEVGVEENKSVLNVDLKPAQKMDVYTFIVVPAKVQVPKIIFKSDDELVLRYDMKGKIKPVPAPFADPEDKTGSVIRPKVPSQLGEYYPFGEFDAKVDSFAFVRQAASKAEPDEESDEESGEEPGEPTRVLEVKLTVKNDSTEPANLFWGTFTPALRDVDGNQVEWDGELYQAKRTVGVNSDLEPKQEIVTRYMIEVPGDVELKTFSLEQDGSRIYEWDVSGVK